MASEKRLIDANALKNKAKYQGHCVRPLVTGYHLCVSVSDIDNASTVDAVEVVHGEWDALREIKRYRGENIPVIQCSECKCYFCDIINNHYYMYHYCPNCGAKMDGERKDNG